MLAAGARQPWMQILFSFPQCLQSMYSNAHKETGPDTAQIIQHSSCLRVRDAGSGQPVSPIKGSAGCEAATRGNDAGILGDAESRLASTHSQRDTHILMNIHTQQKRHMYCTCMRPSQQWCIDFLQFFDEMSYSDSLPRCYFA